MGEGGGQKRKRGRKGVGKRRGYASICSLQLALRVYIFASNEQKETSAALL